MGAMTITSTAAAIWPRDGRRTALAKKIKGLINVDMIGDKSLDIDQETNGNAALNRLVWSYGSGARLQRRISSRNTAATRTTTSFLS